MKLDSFLIIKQKLESAPVELDYLKSLGINIVFYDTEIFFRNDPYLILLKISKIINKGIFSNKINVIFAITIGVYESYYFIEDGNDKLFSPPHSRNQSELWEKDIPFELLEIFKILNIKVHITSNRENELYVTSLSIESP